MSNAIMQLGLIGEGNWGRNYVTTIAQLSSCNLKTVATRSNGNDWKEMCQDPEIQGVIIATPPQVHFEMAEYALEQGKHIIVEKPFVYTGDEAKDISDAKRIEALAKEKGLNVLVGNLNLFNLAFLKMRNIFQELNTGEHPIYINSLGGNWGPFKEDYPGFIDYSPHEFAMLLALVPASGFEIQCIGNPYQLSVQIDFEGGSAVISSGSMMPQKSRSVSIQIGDDCLIFDDLAKDKLTHNGRPVEVKHTMPLTNLVANFCDAIRSEEVRYNAASDVLAMQMMYACLEQVV